MTTTCLTTFTSTWSSPSTPRLPSPIAPSHSFLNSSVLRSLTLNRCLVVSSAGMQSLFFGNQPNHVGFIPLSKTCPNLETVEIDFCSEITNTTIHALAENCTELKTLSLLNVNKIKTQEYVLSPLQHHPIMPTTPLTQGTWIPMGLNPTF